MARKLQPISSFASSHLRLRASAGRQDDMYTFGMSKLSIFFELWRFMRVRKKFWLLPLILLIVLLGLLLIFAQTSPLAPFIYTLV